MIFEKTYGTCHYRLGLAMLANGDTAEAVRLFTAMSDSGESGFAHRAQVVLGECALKAGRYQEAMAFFGKTGPFSQVNEWSVQALLGKLACARHLGLADSAMAFEKQLQPMAPLLLEKERLKKIREIPLVKHDSATNAAAVKTVKPKDTIAAAAASDSSFTLQAGAFGSKERALALKKKLSARFKEVSCVQATVDERHFFRVWVGSFASREEAELFGRQKLTPQGIIYRVVLK